MTLQRRLVVLQQALHSDSSKPSHGDATGRSTRQQKRAAGAYYTPLSLVDFVTELVLTPLLSSSGALRILDPAAGDGRFLRSAHNVLQRAGVRSELIGFERDPVVAAATAAALPHATVHTAEALLAAPVLPLADAVLGNPPYMRSVHLRRTDAALWHGLRLQFAATSTGEWDLYGAFIEKSLQWVRPGGRVGLVVPSRWLTAGFASKLRARVGAELQTVVDFGSQQIFDGATTYVAAIVLQRAAAGTEQAALTSAVTVAHHGTHGWSVASVPRDAVAQVAAPWRLRSTPTLACGGPALHDVASVVKGAGTNADSVFVVEVVRSATAVDPTLTHVRTSDGALHELESAALVPVWRGRDVGGAAPTRACIFPYRDGRLLDPEQLVVMWPRVAAYFATQRRHLEARERGRFAGATYYCFGRPQNLAWLLAPTAKVVLPDVTRGGRASLDTGSLVLDSAYALRPRSDAPAHYQSLPWWRVLLASPVIRLWLDATGIPLRGDYMRMKTAYLRTLPLPPPSTALTASIAAAEAGAWAVSTAALREAYQVSSAQWSSSSSSSAGPTTDS